MTSHPFHPPESTLEHCIKFQTCLLNYLNNLSHFNFKHGSSLYLRFDGLNLSIVIIFKTFHWLKNFESSSVTSQLGSSLLLRQRKVILCCCETTYSLTYQIIISPIPSIPDVVYTHFAQKNL